MQWLVFIANGLDPASPWEPTSRCVYKGFSRKVYLKIEDLFKCGYSHCMDRDSRLEKRRKQLDD